MGMLAPERYLSCSGGGLDPGHSRLLWYLRYSQDSYLCFMDLESKLSSLGLHGLGPAPWLRKLVWYKGGYL